MMETVRPAPIAGTLPAVGNPWNR